MNKTLYLGSRLIQSRVRFCPKADTAGRRQPRQLSGVKRTRLLSGLARQLMTQSGRREALPIGTGLCTHLVANSQLAAPANRVKVSVEEHQHSRYVGLVAKREAESR
jgi:hypothetical protein